MKNDLKYQNISRSLTFEGWNYYKGTGSYEILISKSEYYKIKKDNQAFKDYWKDKRKQLRNT